MKTKHQSTPRAEPEARTTRSGSRGAREAIDCVADRTNNTLAHEMATKSPHAPTRSVEKTGRRNPDVARLPAELLPIGWDPAWRAWALHYPIRSGRPVKTRYGRAVAAVEWLQALVDRQTEVTADEWAAARERLVSDTLGGCAASLKFLELVVPRTAGWARFESIRRRIAKDLPAGAEVPPPEKRPVQWW